MRGAEDWIGGGGGTNSGRARRRWGRERRREANKRGGGGGRWESSKEEMGCDEWRETGREPEKIGFQGGGRERAGRGGRMCPPDPRNAHLQHVVRPNEHMS